MNNIYYERLKNNYYDNIKDKDNDNNEINRNTIKKLRKDLDDLLEDNKKQRGDIIYLEYKNKRYQDINKTLKSNIFNVDAYYNIKKLNYIPFPKNRSYNNLWDLLIKICEKNNTLFSEYYNKHPSKLISFINQHENNFNKIDVIKAMIFYITKEKKPSINFEKENITLKEFKDKINEFIKYVSNYYLIYLENYKRFGEDDKDLYSFYLLMLNETNDYFYHFNNHTYDENITFDILE